jgi:hypothetical protein
LIRERQDQCDQRLPMRGLGFQDVATDAFRLQRFVEQPIVLGLLERDGNGFLAQLF